MSHLDLDARAPWDRVVSLGLMGRAGRGDLDRLIDKARSVLAPDGLCLIHCVGAARPPSEDPFQQGRLFPGWWVGTLAGAASRAAARGLDVLEVRDLRHDYVAIARAWRRDLLRRRAEIARSVGVDDLLVRRWEFYLASLAAGLRAGHLRPLEVLMSRRDRTEDLRPREGAPPAGPRWTNGSAPSYLELAGLS
jgi:cyclopropane-fatty-acyl-phospholipid synthase